MSLQTIMDVMRRTGAHRSMTLQVRRPAEGNRRLQLEVLPDPEGKGTTLLLIFGWTVVIPLAALAAALMLGLLKPDDSRAFVGSLMFLALAGALTLDPLALPTAVAALASGLRTVAIHATALLFLWFFLIFPIASPIERWLPAAQVRRAGGDRRHGAAAAMLSIASVTSFAEYSVCVRSSPATGWSPPSTSRRGRSSSSASCHSRGTRAA